MKMTKEQQFNMVYKNCHKDYKGILDGKKSLMQWIKYGHGLVNAETISDEELNERFDQLHNQHF